jgi:hypothetical protein
VTDRHLVVLEDHEFLRREPLARPHDLQPPFDGPEFLRETPAGRVVDDAGNITPTRNIQALRC